MVVAGSTGASARPRQEDPPQSVKGRLVDNRQPVPGVTIAVADDAGRPVGSTTTAADGTWEVPVPRAGTYRITLDAATLPNGVRLADPSRSSLEVAVGPRQNRGLIFRLGAPTPSGGRDDGARTATPRAEPEGPTSFEELQQSAVNGLKFGLIVAMAAIGLSLIFGMTGLINFAHGELVTLGAVLAWFINARTLGAPLLLAAVGAIAITALLGAILELGLWRPLRKRRFGSFQLVVVSIGLALVIRHVLLLVFEERRRSFTDFVVQERLRFAGVGITPRDLIIMGLSVLTLVGVATLLQRTRIGTAMRAVADDVDLAESSGIDVQRVILVVWIVGAGLAGAGGVMLGSSTSIDWQMGLRLLLLMFAGVILGGLGTAYGAMVGSIVVGLVTEISTLWVDADLKYLFALAALIVILLIRPQGILGVRERFG